MSRSYRKTPIAGIASWDGVKFYKRLHSHQERTKLRQCLRAGDYDVGYQLVRWNEYECSRDGKRWNKNYFDGDITRYVNGYPYPNKYLAIKATVRVYDKGVSKRRKSK